MDFVRLFPALRIMTRVIRQRSEQLRQKQKETDEDNKFYQFEVATYFFFSISGRSALENLSTITFEKRKQEILKKNP